MGLAGAPKWPWWAAPAVGWGPAESKHGRWPGLREWGALDSWPGLQNAGPAGLWAPAHTPRPPGPCSGFQHPESHALGLAHSQAADVDGATPPASQGLQPAGAHRGTSQLPQPHKPLPLMSSLHVSIGTAYHSASGTSLTNHAKGLSLKRSSSHRAAPWGRGQWPWGSGGGRCMKSGASSAIQGRGGTATVCPGKPSSAMLVPTERAPSLFLGYGAQPICLRPPHRQAWCRGPGPE